MSPTRWGPPIDVLPLLAGEEQALIEVLGGLGAEQWAAPTACAGWTVHDLAAHILGDKLGLLSRDRDGYRTTEPRPGEAFGAFLDRINAEWVLACRRLSPEVLFAMLVDSTSQVPQLWGRLDLDDLGEPVTWAGPEPAPSWLAAAREYTEYWVHQQQLRAAVGAPPLDTPTWRAPVIDTFMRALPFTLREVSARVGRQVSYTVTGSSGGRWTAVSSPDGWLLDRATPTSRAPLASVATDADTFWRLCTRNVRIDDVRDRVSLKGDEAVGETVLRMVSIVVS
ncbi:maleylpyruvate isomerase family mycothiol-dependent enzyme [Amycolatopsis sp. H20-H5]|uniref:maleylpyruvate isomerase family mycothiol-dependent enzyme n=1 Tax=Amycolatopsis sp. H20-H5 TaxID=3046309 RepID=UPI002DB80216|nr:maleylpyruvate isomerase family mycothiol-dependent enzyme [Amycolatopsis sp. H20-H5]MEC3979931.1 maleylpyruvate isomerase family mycothiol-dependent enzyme [Amycolatopsis sp. H20-H5]